MQLGLFDLFALFLRCDLVIICLRRFLLKLGFFDSLVIFLFSWKHVYLKCKQNYFQRLHGFSNLNWSLSSCLKLWYISCFGSNFSNFVFRKVHIISRWSLKPVSKEFVFINENFEFIITKSMHEPPSPLKHVFCFIIFWKVCSWRRSFITLFSVSLLKSPKMITFSCRVE